MFRKLTIALGAAAVVAAAALTPTVASAAPGWHGHGGHGHHGHHRWHRGIGIGFYGPAYYAGTDCYVVRRVVYTSHGKRWRRVTVCN
jgi:hypothetical protein